jgi:RecJ-like exonuclease
MKQKFNKNKQRKNFQSDRKFHDKPKTELKYSNLEKINASVVGQRFVIRAIIDSVNQTSGPTLFSVTDGTGLLILKGFESPGERAYPHIKETDAIEAIIQVNEFNGMLEGEIKKITKLDDQNTAEFKKHLENLERERSKPPQVNFLIQSPILDKLKEEFIKAATEIRLAVIQNRPIIIRHHNDADGYSAGFALERAILPLIEKHHGPGKAAWEFYLRAPCAAPFYEIDDSIRDTAMSLRNVAKFSNKMPLVVIVDNGSSPEDLMAIKQGKVHGSKFIVIDHHFFDEDVISGEVLVHINPFLVGENGSAFSAGMLCTEIARFINSDVKNVEQIAALAGYADKIDLTNPQTVSDYLRIAEKNGYTKSLLSDIATVIDFVSSKLKFMEAREFIEVIFGEPRDKQKELVDLLAPYIKQLDVKGLAIAKSSARTEKIGKVTLQTLSIEENFPGFGFFPKPGRVVGLLHDDLKETKKISSLITVGIMYSAITIRATDEANFSVHTLIKYINEKNKHAFAEGGGHKNAGSITFIPSQQQEVLSLLREFIKQTAV